jgi:hypothetical protein
VSLFTLPILKVAATFIHRSHAGETIRRERRARRETQICFDARIMVLSGEITIVRDNKAETFKAGDHCEIAAGCQHTAQVGPEGVADIVGKACRR